MGVCMKPIHILVPVLLGAVAAMPGAHAASSQKRVCKPKINSSGIHKFKQSAIRISQQQWAQQAQALYNASWAKLENASVVLSGCSRPDADWICVYNARPCRWESTLAPKSLMPSIILKMKPNAN